MPIGSPIVNTLPTPGVTTSWGDDLNLVLNEIIDAIEARVTPSGINMNADIDTGGNSFTNLAVNRFTDRSSTLTGAADTRKLYTFGGQLYFTDSAQVAHAITPPGAATNGITGAGYGAPIELNWDGVGLQYRFKDGAAADDFATVQMSILRLADGSSNYADIAVPALAANRTYTLPAAPPAATNLLQMDATGVVSVSNTVPNGLTVSTGDLTVTAGDLVLTAGEIQHGDKALLLAGASFQGGISGSDWDVSAAATFAGEVFSRSANQTFCATIPLITGDRIKSIVVAYRKAAAEVCTATLDRHPGTLAGGVRVSSNTGSSTGDTSITIASINHTLVADNAYVVTLDNLDSGDRLYFAKIVYDHP